MHIYELLDAGKENRKTTSWLRKATGLSLRELRDEIRKERRQGHLILSGKGCGGYWLFSGKDEDIEELLTFCREYRRPALDMLKTLAMFIAEAERRKEKGA